MFVMSQCFVGIKINSQITGRGNYSNNQFILALHFKDEDA